MNIRRLLAFALAAVVLVLVLRGKREKVADENRAGGQDARVGSPPCEISAVEERAVETTATTSAVSGTAPRAAGPEAAASPPSSRDGSPGAAAGAVVAAEAPLPLPRRAAGGRVIVPPGGAMVLGGWPDGGGRRVLIVVSPEPVVSGGQNFAKLTGRFVAVPAARLDSRAWESVLSTNDFFIGGGVYDAGASREFMASLENDEADVLSSPTVVTTYGSRAEITIMSTDSGGKPRGISLALIAREAAGQAGVDLAVQAAQYGEPSDAAK